MDFPKDNPPSHEEMIATYEQTCAKGLNISLEEAKKRMYACSTTTYQGFQAIMTEEESEKFRDVPGVVFILPDSYIDPVNKEYGGDKYENGVITPRPPPIQYSSRGRIRDRNRNPDQSRYDRQGTSMSNRQGNSPYNQQVPMQGDGRNYGPPQNYSPQHNYGMPGQGIPMSNRQGNPPYSQQGPMQGDGKNYGPPQNYSPQQNYGIPGQGERRDHMPMSNRDYAPGGRDTYQTDRRGPMPSNQGHYNPGGQGSYNPGGQGNYSQEQRNFPPRDQVNYSPPSQGDFRVGNRNYAPTHGGSYEGATNPNYGQSYTGHGEGQGFPPVDERNVQGEPRNHVPLGQRDQGSY